MTQSLLGHDNSKGVAAKTRCKGIHQVEKVAIDVAKRCNLKVLRRASRTELIYTADIRYRHAMIEFEPSHVTSQVTYRDK